MISALTWTRKGTAKPDPRRLELDDEQMDMISKVTTKKLKDAIEDRDESLALQASKMTFDDDPDLAKFKMDEYDDDNNINDDDEENNDNGNSFIDKVLNGALDRGSDDENMGNLEEEGLNGDDQMDNEEDLEDLAVLPTDQILLSCKTEDGLSYLEFYIYEESDDNLYVHHDILLPSFPLSLCWIYAKSSDVLIPKYLEGKDVLESEANLCKNLVAVGMLEENNIEIWDLDVLDPVYPYLILEGVSEVAKDKKKKKKKGKPTTELKDSTKLKGHSGSVLCLDWNKSHSNLLASGSADCTVKLWDLTTGHVIATFDKIHSDKVQCLKWNLNEKSRVLTASYDKTVKYWDMMHPEAAPIFSNTLNSDPEAIAWNPHNPNRFMISEESGYVQCFDVATTKCIFSCWAHSKSVTAVEWHPYFANIFLTASTDSTIKIWQIENENTVVALAEKNLSCGQLFTASWSNDSKALIAAAGSEGVVKVVDLSEIISNLSNQ